MEASDCDIGLGPRVVAVAGGWCHLWECYDRSSCRDRQVGRSAGKLKRPRVTSEGVQTPSGKAACGSLAGLAVAGS